MAQPRSTVTSRGRADASSMSIVKLFAEITCLPILVAGQVFLLCVSVAYKCAIDILPYELATILKDLVKEEHSSLILPSFKQPAASPLPPPAPIPAPAPIERHDTLEQFMSPTHYEIPQQQEIPIAEQPESDTVRRRPRPASYHGATATSTLQTHNRVHSVLSGGIRPLHLPAVVASTTTSPRLGVLPELDAHEDAPAVASVSVLSPSPNPRARRLSDSASRPLSRVGGIRYKHSSTDDTEADRSFDAGRLPHTAPYDKTSFQLDQAFNGRPVSLHNASSSTESAPGVTGTGGGGGSPIKHQRETSEQTFAQHEREALLFRIAELESALLQQKREQDEQREASTSDILSQDTAVEGVLGGAASSSVPAAAGGAEFESSSRYPSPPTSPPEGARPALLRGESIDSVPEGMKDIHETRVLEDMSASHPRLRLISPTLFMQEGSSPSNGDAVKDYFDDSVEVSSPTRT